MILAYILTRILILLPALTRREDSTYVKDQKVINMDEKSTCYPSAEILKKAVKNKWVQVDIKAILAQQNFREI